MINKILSITLALSFITYVLYRDYEYGYIIGALLSFHVAYAASYMWTNHSLKESILKHLKSINEIHNLP